MFLPITMDGEHVYRVEDGPVVTHRAGVPVMTSHDGVSFSYLNAALANVRKTF